MAKGFSGGREDRFGNAVPAAVFFVLAILLRAPGLGKWGLAVDEFYFSRGVRFILENGVPMFPGGGYYVRGILLQYLTVIPVSFIDNFELAVRILPVLFGAATIPMFYLFCTKFLGRFESILCAVILLLSSWHIELSRFARMYMPFQFFFFLFLYNVHSGYREDSLRHRFAAWHVAALTVFVYEGSVIPALLLAALILTGDAGKTKRKLTLFTVLFIALLSLNLAMNIVDFRTLGIPRAELAVEPLPGPSPVPAPATKYEPGGPVLLPDTSLMGIACGSWPGKIALALLACAGTWLTARGMRRYEGDSPRTALFLAMAFLPVLPLLHQFGLLAVVVAVLAMNRKDLRLAVEKDLPYWGIYLLLALAFWTLVAFRSGNLDRILHFLTGYPPVKYAVAGPFMGVMPMWTTFLFGIAALSVVRNVLFPGPDEDAFPVTMLVLCLAVTAVFNTLYRETRYSFFFFPLLIVVAMGEFRALRRYLAEKAWPALGGRAGALLFLLPVAAFLLTEDFHLRHVTDVSAPELNFRTGKYLRFSDHWYPRFDFESAGRFVEKEYREGDVVMLEQVAMSQYLGVPFSNYVERKSERFHGIARKNGNEELWSGRPLLSDAGRLAAKVPENGENSLWLIGIVWDFKGEKRRLADRYEKMAEEHGLAIETAFLGIDGRTGVLKVRRRTADKKTGVAGAMTGAEDRESI